MTIFRRFSIFVSLVLLAFCLTGMGGKPGKEAAPQEGTAESSASAAPLSQVKKDDPLPASVTNVSIMDRDTLAQNKPLVVTFSDAMVKDELVDQPVDEAAMPFVLKPGVAGQGRWLTKNSFAFIAERGFRPGKKYALLLKDDLRSLEGRPVQFYFSFKTDAPKLNRLQPGAYDAANLQQVLHFDFSMPVSLAALAEHLSVIDAQSGEAITLDLTRAPEKGSSFAVVAELGAERKELKVTLREDWDNDRHPLGFAKAHTATVTLNPDGGESAVKADGASPIKPYHAYSYQDGPGRMAARFELSGELQTHAQKSFIKVEPELPYTLNSYADSLLFSEKLEPGMQIRVTLLPGLTDASGRVLKEERSMSFTVEDYEAAASFAEPGSFLTPLFGAHVGLNLVNVDQVNVSLERQYDNNLPFMAISPDYNARGMMRNLAFKEIPVKNPGRNVIERRALDVQELAAGQKGVFLLEITSYERKTDGDGKAYMGYGNREERLIVLTDIGVTARCFPSGVTVFASSIASALPLSDAEVRVYSASNQLIARGHTDRDGLFVHKRSAPWDPQLTPSVITVSHGSGEASDLTFLPLNGETGIYHDDPAGRAYLENGYEAFMYTPRGVFRPGETVDLKAFVRDASHEAPAPFPVLFRVISSRGLEAARGTATLSDEGGAGLSFALPASAPTGTYSAVLEVPGQQDAVIGSCSFSVEEFTPPRLEVLVTPSQQRLLPGETFSVGLSGQYLFGAPGANLGYELGYRASMKDFLPQGFAGYAFGDREKRFDAQVNLRYVTGELNEDGTGDIRFPVPADWQPPALLNVKLIGSVQEDGGRWVTQTSDFIYYPTPWLLGLKLDGDALSPGAEGVFNVAAVTPDGGLADCGPLTVEISRVQSVWHTVYRNNRYIYTQDERFIAQEKLIAASEDGKARFSFTPDQYGTYLVRVASQDGSVVASRRFGAYGSDGYAGPEGGGRMDKVELSFDKAAYLPGETAKLSVKAPYPGTLYLGVERAEQVSTRVMRMEEAATVVDIPVVQGMDPNVSVTAWVIRPVREENKEWYAHRAHGMAALMIAKEPHTLQVSASAPKKASPSAPLAVAFTVTDNQGLPVEGEFSVALVDEGILSLTGFATPDPVRFFMARRSAAGWSHDAFDALLRPEARTTPLLKAGGDGAESYQGSLSTQQIFLAAFLPTVRTDANGQAEALFDIPEYSGKGRLMIVGAAGNRFASGESQVRFARDLVVESSAPRAVAPGDVFELGVKLFTLPVEGEPPLSGEARLSVTCEGPVSIDGQLEQTLPLGAPGNAPDNSPDNSPDNARNGQQAGPQSHSLTFAATAGDAADIARITVSVSVPGRDDLNFAKTLEVAVRPPYPRTSESASALLREGERKELAINGAWLAGKTASAVSIDRSPVIAVLPALEYLREYPYGCLEQVTSRAWPYLTLTEVQKALDKSANATDASTMLSGVVARIASMQTPEGGFSMWPGGASPDPWKSVNATFFLIEAKAQVPVAPALLENALGYLRLVLAAPAEALGNAGEGWSVKAFAAFVLTRAGEAPLGWVQHLAEQEKAMLPSGRIFLAGARALKAGNAEALKALGQNAPLEGMDKARVGYNRTMESALRNKSLLLYMWTLVAPLDEETKALCLDVAAMLGKSRYYSTQEAGMAALALGGYLEKTGGGSGTFKAEVGAPGADPIIIDDGKAATMTSSETPLDADGKALPVSVRVLEGEAYAVYNVRGTPKQAPAPRSSGLSVSRVWKDADGNVIDLSTGSAALKRGDRIVAELTVTAERPVSDVALSDLLPGGLEVENPRLNTAAAETDDGADEWGLFIDLREDRLLVFFDRLEAGKARTFSYSLRAVSKGSFVLPPLAADAMYDPEISAITGSGTLTVE